MTAEPGWFLFNGLTRFDAQTGAKQQWRFPKGVFASESPMAPTGADEDSGYVLTYVTDMNDDRSEAQIFDAADVSAGPIARVLLPERISSGTHTVWAPEESLAGAERLVVARRSPGGGRAPRPRCGRGHRAWRGSGRRGRWPSSRP